MSADNCICLARFLENGKYEYRVTHAQAIECCDKGQTPNEITNANRVLYFGNVPVFTDYEEALKRAMEMANECIILEYGIQSLEYDEPFPKMNREEAEAIIEEEYQKSRPSFDPFLDEGGEENPKVQNEHV